MPSPNLKTKTARRKLAPKHKPYWASIRRGVYLGYRRGSGLGSWRARVYAGEKHYRENFLGLADDGAEADGVEVFDYDQAQEKALAFWSRDPYRERRYQYPGYSGRSHEGIHALVQGPS